MNNEIITIGEIPGVVRKFQGEQEYFFGTIPSDKIKNVTFVPVIEESRSSKGIINTYLNEDPENGYQRPGSKTRMRAFAKFLKENRNSIVPPVLLSGRGKWIFEQDEQDENTGKLLIQDKAAIIDGQHRIGGFVFLYDNDNDVRHVSFILLSGLDMEKEKNEFIVVNNTQKGVPKPLTAYLEDSEEAQIAWRLNEEHNSPFLGKITKVNLKNTHLFALHSVARQVKRLFSLGSIRDLDIDEKVEYMSEFWIIIADELPDEWADIDKLDIDKLDSKESKGRSDFEYKLLELTGLIAWSHIGSHIFLRCYRDGMGMNWHNVRRLVQATAGIDWSKQGEYEGRTGEAGGKAMSDEMISMLPPEGDEVSLDTES